MSYVFERPAADWVCETCGEGPDRCQWVSEGEMMYPPLREVESDERVDFDALAALPKAKHIPSPSNPNGLFGF